MKLYELAKEYRELFEVKTRKKDSEEEKIITYKRKVFRNPVVQKLYEEISDLIQDLKQEMDEDSAFKYTYEALNWIIDNEIEDCEQARDKVPEGAEQNCDIYTGALTEWLNKAPVNVNWITEVLIQLGEFEDGEQLLATAQLLCIERVFRAVVDFLCERISED
jgi:hypothetical protein